MTGKHWTTNDLPDGGDEMAGAFLAADYHGGQMTALYALSSTGSLELYPGEGLARLRREVAEAVDIAAREHPEDHDALAALLRWIDTQEGDR